MRANLFTNLRLTQYHLLRTVQIYKLKKFKIMPNDTNAQYAKKVWNSIPSGSYRRRNILKRINQDEVSAARGWDYLEPFVQQSLVIEYGKTQFNYPKKQAAPQKQGVPA